ncbi:MAG: hypothetical protein NUW00_00055 [Candidatus Kaiserbacteria bacterium]|nr:hypothetical protein [Candidatus Kaiserbacteria bacterium]
MFYLPNNVAIDVDGIIDGMLDGDINILYFLDGKTGDVVSGEDGKSLPTDNTRYFQIPKIHLTSKEKWMKDFIRGLVYIEDKKLAGKLKEVFDFSGVYGVCEFLEEHDESWLVAWDEWQENSTFERLEVWFATLPLTIEAKWHGDDDCVICRAMREGADEEELLEAFAEQNELNNTTSVKYTDIAKTVEEVEQQLVAILTQYAPTKQITVQEVKKWVWDESGDPMRANKEYFEKWMMLFDLNFDDTDFKIIMDAFTDAWNYFPHKSLGGKSPRQMFESER